MWSLHFLHPKGGFAKIEIHAVCKAANSFKIIRASYWWVTDYDRCTRAAVSTELLTCEVKQASELAPLLEDSFRELISLTESDLKARSATMPRDKDKAGNYVFSKFELAQRSPT